MPCGRICPSSALWLRKGVKGSKSCYKDPKDAEHHIGPHQLGRRNIFARIAWALLAKGGTYRAPTLAAAA